MPTTDKVQQFSNPSQELPASGYTSVDHVHHVVGFLVAYQPLFPCVFVPFHYTWPQFQAVDANSPNKKITLLAPVDLGALCFGADPRRLPELSFNFWCWESHPDYGAPKVHWGAILENQKCLSTQGQMEESLLHVNLLDILAMFVAPQQFEPSLQRGASCYMCYGLVLT